MSKEISFKKKGYAATFILDNAPDCDICQLYAVDEKNKKTVQISNWLRGDFFFAYMKSTDEMISDLKAKIEEKDKAIYQNTLTIEDLRKQLKGGAKYAFESTSYGKFENADKLYEAYLNLEKEYTKTRQELAEKNKLFNQYPYKNDVIEKQYDDLKNSIKINGSYKTKHKDVAEWEQCFYHKIDVLCEKHKARIVDIESSICAIEKLEETNKKLLDLKAKEMGEALSDAFNNFTVAIRNKLDKETILEYLRTHNKDKIKMLVDIKESLEDINDYLLKKGDITNAGSDKILDYIDCKIEQQKGGAE